MKKNPRPGYVLLEVPESVAADLATQLGAQQVRQNSAEPLSTAEAAKAIGMSPEYVRDHALGLGGVKRGNAWRFDPAGLEQGKEGVSSGNASAEPTTAPKRRRRSAKTDLLPITGEPV